MGENGGEGWSLDRHDLLNIPEALYKNKPIENMKQFTDFLETADLSKFPRNDELGRYLKIMRYNDIVENACKKIGIPEDYLFGLIMIESEGNIDTVTFDGGAGPGQFQPDVAKEMCKRIVFTDMEEYKNLDFFTRMKQKLLAVKQKIFGKKANSKELSEKTYKKEYRKARLAIYREQGSFLRNLKKDEKDEFEDITETDERFDPEKAIPMMATYLKQIKDRIVSDKGKNIKEKSWNIYKNDKDFDLTWLLACNGYNKGPARYWKNFEGSKKNQHIANLKRNILAKRDFDKWLPELMKKKLSGAQIIAKLKEKFKEKRKEKEESDTPNKEVLAKKSTGKAKANEPEIVKIGLDKKKEYMVFRCPVKDTIHAKKMFTKYSEPGVKITDKTGKLLSKNDLDTFKKGGIFYIKESQKKG